MAKIMLVEDDNNLREIYEARLLAEGYEIVSAHDGEEALALAIKEKPDLIISDIMMPKISGFDMLDILRGTPEIKDTKVIMMTALSQAEDQSRAGNLGADKYLVKSQVTLEDVARIAREVLAKGKREATVADESADAQQNPLANIYPTPGAAASSDNTAAAALGTDDSMQSDTPGTTVQTDTSAPDAIASKELSDELAAAAASLSGLSQPSDDDSAVPATDDTTPQEDSTPPTESEASDNGTTAPYITEGEPAAMSENVLNSDTPEQLAGIPKATAEQQQETALATESEPSASAMTTQNESEQVSPDPLSTAEQATHTEEQFTAENQASDSSEAALAASNQEESFGNDQTPPAAETALQVPQEVEQEISNAQSAKSEESTVEKQIEDFIESTQQINVDDDGNISPIDESQQTEEPEPAKADLILPWQEQDSGKAEEPSAEPANEPDSDTSDVDTTATPAYPEVDAEQQQQAAAAQEQEQEPGPTAATDNLQPVSDAGSTAWPQPQEEEQAPADEQSQSAPNHTYAAQEVGPTPQDTPAPDSQGAQTAMTNPELAPSKRKKVLHPINDLNAQTNWEELLSKEQEKEQVSQIIGNAGIISPPNQPPMPGQQTHPQEPATPDNQQ
jgi:CheY-like chemotaxis protein